MNISESELLEAVRTAMTPNGTVDGYTGPEIAELTGYPTPKVWRILKLLIRDGRVEIVTLNRQRVNGINATIKGYRFK
jgi:uncharacterized membrane protein